MEADIFFPQNKKAPTMKKKKTAWQICTRNDRRISTTVAGAEFGLIYSAEQTGTVSQVVKINSRNRHTHLDLQQEYMELDEA